MKSDEPSGLAIGIFILAIFGTTTYMFGRVSLRKQFDTDLYQEMLRKQQARDAYTRMAAAQQQYLEAVGVKLD